MRRILVENIKGNEILAKSIFSKMDTVLMPAGTIMRREYGNKLNELGIEAIFIKDDLSEGISEAEITENDIKEQCQNMVAETINRYAYSGNNEFEQLKTVTREIVEDILNKPEVMFNISGVRQKDEFIYSHSINVCALSILLGIRMNLPERTINDIAIGSILHDIGYMNTPFYNITNRKREEFTNSEMKSLRMHVIHGYSSIENERWLGREAKEIILSHHEYMDGSGYPMRLKGDRLSIGTKIVCVCNFFDNLVYGWFTKKIKVNKAMDLIMSLAGKLFDINVVKMFNDSVAAYPVGSMIRTNKDEIGIVLHQNNGFPTRPVIRIIKDNKGNFLEKWIEKDLTQELTLFIKEEVEL